MEWINSKKPIFGKARLIVYFVRGCGRRYKRWRKRGWRAEGQKLVTSRNVWLHSALWTLFVNEKFTQLKTKRWKSREKRERERERETESLIGGYADRQRKGENFHFDSSLSEEIWSIDVGVVVSWWRRYGSDEFVFAVVVYVGGGYVCTLERALPRPSVIESRMSQNVSVLWLNRDLFLVRCFDIPSDITSGHYVLDIKRRVYHDIRRGVTSFRYLLSLVCLYIGLRFSCLLYTSRCV